MAIDQGSDATPILEVAEFYQLLTLHLESSFGRRHPVWVRGEIAKVFEKGHVYIDVVDAGSAASDTKRPVLNAHCWSAQWLPIKRSLAADGISLRAGMIVNFFGYVDLYAPQGRVGFTVTQIDVQGLLGDVARRRQELIAALQREGLMEANKRIAVSALPLRIGLVASPGTEGFNDFTGQLRSSDFAFEVVVVPTAVQGDSAPLQIVNALLELDAAGVDVICMVRGGGSKGDLACFDDERVARAIAATNTAVFTGIGHTGDESIADLMAHTRAITPTKLGEELVKMVEAWRERNIREPARRVMSSAGEIIDGATVYVQERRRTMILAVRDRLRAEERHLTSVRSNLATHSRHVVADAQQFIATRRRLLEAYDPHRRLAQGWSIVTDVQGRVVSTLDDVSIGAALSITVRDGKIAVTVSDKDGETA